jgi:hypothetical protein
MPQPEILRYATFLHSEQALPRRPRAHTVPIHGAARLARAEDLSLLLRPAESRTRTTPIASFSPLLEGPDGALAPAYDETLHLSEELRSRHLLAVGITGSGKTTRVLQKLLAADIRDRRPSLVVLDVKVEMYSWLQRCACRVAMGWISSKSQWISSGVG